MSRKAGRSLRRNASGLCADEEHETFFKFWLKTKYPICSSSKKGAKERQNKKRKCVKELCKGIDCESEMDIIGEGDSEKGNIDDKTSARKETRSVTAVNLSIIRLDQHEKRSTLSCLHHENSCLP